MDATREENIGLMIEVIQGPNLHNQARKCYKYTGTNVASDGSEDWRTCRETMGVVGGELQRKPKVNSAVAEVDAAYARGAFPCTYKHVQSLFVPCPRKQD